MGASEQPGFLQRRPLRRALARWSANWQQRHRHPFNFALHLVGIPLALLVAPVLLLLLPWADWYWAGAAFVGGYLLQWLGHRVEGNDLGEWAGIKRLLGLPYVAISPRSEAEKRQGDKETRRQGDSEGH